MAISSQNKPVVTTIEEPKPIKGETKLDIVRYTLVLPTEPMEVFIVSNIQVKVLK
jgi:hypothetical protein